MRNFLKYKIFLLGILVISAFNHAVADDNEKVKSFVSNLGDQVIGIINDETASDQQKELQLESLFKSNVDTNWMGIFAMGRHFRALPNNEQKKRYLNLYSEYLVSSYVPRFRNYTGEKFDILSVKSDNAEEYTVKTEIKSHDGGPNTKVDYKIRKGKNGELKVIDIIGEGVSLITTQRSDFGGIIANNGIDGLLAKLEEKVKEQKKTNPAKAS